MQLNLFAALDQTELNDGIIYRESPTFRQDAVEFITEIEEQKTATLVMDCETARGENKDAFLKDQRLPRMIERENYVPGNALNFSRLSVRLLQIGYKGKVLILDLWLDNCSLLIKRIQKICESDQYTKVFHNAIFDLTAFRAEFGWQFKNVRCTRILSNMCYAGFKFETHSLKRACDRELGMQVDKELGCSDWTVPSPLSNEQLNYAAIDILATSKLYDRLLVRLREIDKHTPETLINPFLTSIDIYDIHCGALPAFAELNVNGMPLTSLEEIETAIKEWKEAIAKIAAPALDWLGKGFTLTTHPAKLSTRIFELTGVLITKEELEDEDIAKEDFKYDWYGNVVVGNELKAQLSAKAHQIKFTAQEYPLLENFVVAKGLLKQLQVLEAMKKAKKEYKDGRLRGSYNPLGSTGSGRSTCSKGGNKSSLVGINLQNLAKQPENAFSDSLPSPVRSLIKSEDPTKRLIIQDAASSHIRILYSLCPDPALGAILNDPKTAKLMHSMLASEVATMKGKPATPEEIESGRKDKNNPRAKEFEKLRSISKTVFYAALNRGSAPTVQAALAKSGVFVTVEDCQATIDAWKKKYKDVDDFQSYLIKTSGKLGVKSLETYYRKDGSKYSIPHIRFKSASGRIYGAQLKEKEDREGNKILRATTSEYLAVNWLCIEALCFNRALKNIHEHIQREFKNDMKLIGFIHDECVLESTLDRAKEAAFIAAFYLDEAYTWGLRGKLDSGIDMENTKAIESSICQNYSEK